MAESAGAARAVADDSKGVKLFAASARKLLPRLVSSICVTGVGLVVFGPIWAALWFLASWAVVFAGMGLMRLIHADPAAPTRPARAMVVWPQPQPMSTTRWPACKPRVSMAASPSGWIWPSSLSCMAVQVSPPAAFQ